jgi:isopenicillin N synthase-like dioxygenase
MFKAILILGIVATATAHFWNRAEASFSDAAKVDYSELVHDNTNIDSKILSAMQTFGFFYVNNVPEYNATIEQQYLERFFDLPEEQKESLEIRRHNPDNTNAYRGYCPGLDDVDTTLQFKNVFNIGPHEVRYPTPQSEDALEKLRYEVSEPNVWPETDDCTFDKEFKEVFQVGFEIRRNIARAFVRSISRSLGFSKLPELFSEDEFSAMGLRRYPVRQEINTNMYSDFDGRLLRELEHVDSTVTVLSTFNNGGLQALYKNQYREVPVTGEGFLVNIGKLVDDIIDHKLVSLKHRVVETSADRHSITYFLGPAFDADISKSMSGQPTEAGRKYTIFGEWIKDYLGAIELFYY